MDLSLFATFSLIVGLELVLGIDNILLISILTDRLPIESRNKARVLGLALAFFIRCFLLLGASYLVQLDKTVVAGLSWKAIVLLLGGAFLLYKSVTEIHHVVEESHEDKLLRKAGHSFSKIIFQIVLLDVVFSIDSVITAVGLTNNLWVIYTAVIASFLLVLLFSGKIASFIQQNPTLKILALSFLVTIGVVLMLEGLGHHIPKAYIYLPMGFALFVEALQMRFQYNIRKIK